MRCATGVSRMKLIWKSLALAAAVITMPANAATIIAGNNGLLDQIHSAGTQAASTTVFGKTQNSNDGITFTSTSTLDINGSGYAQIDDADLNDGEVFDNFNLFLSTNPNGFTAVEFSIQYAAQVLKDLGDGKLTVTMEFLDGTTQSFAPITFSGPGLQDYQINASGSEVFKALRLTSNVQFDMIKQNDITIAAAVPEPATWMMMLIGMAGVGFSMRRKDKQTLRVRFS